LTIYGAAVGSSAAAGVPPREPSGSDSTSVHVVIQVSASEEIVFEIERNYHANARTHGT
jgi:hypothetical protein